nr:hypothetical protein [Halomonas tianxiuensis]
MTPVLNDPDPDATSQARVQQLTAGDISTLHDLLTVFGDAFGEPDTYGVARPGRAYLERLLGRDSFIALAVLKGAEVVGGWRLTSCTSSSRSAARSIFTIWRWQKHIDARALPRC